MHPSCRKKRRRIKGSKEKDSDKRSTSIVGSKLLTLFKIEGHKPCLSFPPPTCRQSRYDRLFTGPKGGQVEFFSFEKSSTCATAESTLRGRRNVRVSRGREVGSRTGANQDRISSIFSLSVRFAADLSHSSQPLRKDLNMG